MVCSIGCDIVQIPRIEALLEKNEQAFLARVFTKAEQHAAEKYSQNRQGFIAHFAKRFAAKEAFAKALGTGFGQTISMQDVAVENTVKGAPLFIFSSKAQAAIEASFGEGAMVKLSLSDDYPQALAFVIIEKA